MIKKNEMVHLEIETTSILSVDCPHEEKQVWLGNPVVERPELCSQDLHMIIHDLDMK